MAKTVRKVLLLTLLILFPLHAKAANALDHSQFTKTFGDEFTTFDWYNPDPIKQVGKGTWVTNFMFRPDSNDTGNRVLTNNGEEELYVDRGFRGKGFTPLGLDPFAIKDGKLIITADKAPEAVLSNLGGYRYISGLITTVKTFSQTYGLFEMRAKLPKGQGLWPAFWLLPTDRSWPPEIDVMEILENKPGTLYTSVHTKHENQSNPTLVTQMADSSADFHDYAVDWEADQIVFYVDGQEVARKPTPSDMHKPMYMLVNLAVGGKWPGNPDATTVFPAHMEIDWVRAYKRK